MHPIARYRKVKGWTQTDLANEVGVALNTVQTWERGTEPRPQALRRLAEALSVDVGKLLDEIVGWKQRKTAAA